MHILRPLRHPSSAGPRRTWGEQNTEAEAIEQLNYSVHEAGVNFIDTAEMYPVGLAMIDAPHLYSP